MCSLHRHVVGFQTVGRCFVHSHLKDLNAGGLKSLQRKNHGSLNRRIVCLHNKIVALSKTTKCKFTQQFVALFKTTKCKFTQ
jgi:hypothetical protein